MDLSQLHCLADLWPLPVPVRFMLHLAQESDGVIVTNDNLRDLLDESQAWKDIIKKR